MIYITFILYQPISKQGYKYKRRTYNNNKIFHTNHHIPALMNKSQLKQKQQNSDSISNTINVGSNYHYLFMKQFLAQIKKHQNQLKQFVKENVALETVLSIDKYELEDMKTVFYNLFGKLKEVEWVRKCVNSIADKLLQKSKQMYEFPTQRNYFLAQSFRQTCNPPLATQHPSPNLLNFSRIFKISINKQLRRTLWSKSLHTEQTKQQYFKYDHKIIPYNLKQQLTINMIRISQQNTIKLKQNQKDCYLRLLEYLIKKWDRLPNKNEQLLALNVIQVYAFFTPSRMAQIGAVFVGLGDLAQFYFQENIEKRLGYLSMAYNLVDPQTYITITQKYLPFSVPSQLNQIFEHFRLTLSTSFFPMAGSQYIIDQLLIKRRNKFDIYIVFCLLTMIMSDDLEKYKEDKLDLIDIVNVQKCKKTIKLDDVIDAFKGVYEAVDYWHTQAEGKLAQKLREFDAQLEKDKAELSRNSSKPVSLKIIQPMDEMTGFVVQNKGPILRLGSK